MRAHVKVEVFGVCKALNLPAVSKDSLAITVLDLESDFYLITSKDPLERALVGYNIFGNVEAIEILYILNMASIITRKFRI